MYTATNPFEMTTPGAKIIADSISPDGNRLTTLQVECHRFVLAEFNTHRVFSRNSASSRAIPTTKRLNVHPQSQREFELSLWHNPADPLVWVSEQPGMQGGEPLIGEDLADAKLLWAEMQEYMLTKIGEYVDTHEDPASRLHKSLLNRPLEWFMWHTICVTATDWDGFFRQRATPPNGVSLAQLEFTAVADAMRDALDGSNPTPIGWDEWHLPYVDDEDLEATLSIGGDPRFVSSARCARTSHLTQEGKRDVAEDLALFGRLEIADPEHSSPLEHVATPADEFEIVPGNFTGWRQLRHEIFGR